MPRVTRHDRLPVRGDCRAFACCGWLMLAALLVPASDLHALVISEIMYHSDEVDDRPYEFIDVTEDVRSGDPPRSPE